MNIFVALRKNVGTFMCTLEITESFHPNSIRRIRELEMPLQPPDEGPEAPQIGTSNRETSTTSHVKC
uniref:Uncharacterized protein n=1 Tax=Ascaris lumbricoides TaxID=6252 RepID=A0A0M3IUC6_ASCLU